MHATGEFLTSGNHILYSTSATGGESGEDEAKHATHNLPWSDEEQMRLEELLQIYPDEPVQAQRFNKISAALGTRTPRQVASRVQKYFIKLAKNGLPVPGRITIPVRVGYSVSLVIKFGY
jgi:hypothetical protein